MTQPSPAEINLSAPLLQEIFPFHLVFDPNLKIIQVGKALERISPISFLNQSLSDCFEIIRPNTTYEFTAFLKRHRALFLLKSRTNGLRLKGQMIHLEELDAILFLCYLWITDQSELGALGIKLKDFPPHDPIMDFLFLLQAKDTALTEVNQLLQDLKKHQVELEKALEAKAQLADLARIQASQLEQALNELKQAQVHLIQTEKMSSLGQLMAGIAHEINNPINFIQGNLKYVQDYNHNLLKIVQLYRQSYPQNDDQMEQVLEDLELDFILEDLPKVLSSMTLGTERIGSIVQSLQVFSRHDQAEHKLANVHDGLDSTLHILSSRLKRKPGQLPIEVICDYGPLPDIECYPSQLNQVFMNILVNGIDALEERDRQRSMADIDLNPSQIIIQTMVLDNRQVVVKITDNGLGIPDKIQSQLFEPFFTTKPVGQGTGLGLSISYQIVVDKHQGQLSCDSTIGEGTTFTIVLPI